MSRDFVVKEVDRIINNKTLSFPLNLAMASAWLIAHYKGINLKILDVKGLTHLADYFILGSATNRVQALAISQEIEAHLERHEFTPISKEGLETGEWVLFDYGDIMISIFQESVRDVFDMDHLWKDAPRVEIPTYYYQTTSSDTVKKTDGGDTGGYF